MNAAHVGKVVDGRYRLDRLLGEGAAGAVYAATQLSVDRIVAVKLLHEANTERFAAEAKAIAKLNHTNVITLHDFGFDAELGAHFMVTEYAEGIPLSERMREVMSTDLILRVSLEIASALHHAHANGVLHRDLKPENVILTRADGRVDVAKVLDFGLAHLFGDNDAPETAAPVVMDAADIEEPVADTAVMEPLAADEAPEQTTDDDQAEYDDNVAETTAMKAVDVDALLAIPGEEGEAGTPPDLHQQQAEPDTAVLAPMDLSADSLFREEEE